MQRLVLCCGALLCTVGVGVAQPQGKQGAAAVSAADKQGAAGNKKAAARQGAREQRLSKAAQGQSPRAREQRRAKNHITAAFPRTRSLLAYLEQRDAEAFGTLLSHSEKLTHRLESAALEMAKQHHPELSGLLLRLRGHHPRSYKSAIRELVGDHQRIQRAKTRGEGEHDLALREWKLRSQARLIAAQMTVKNAPELSRQLTTVLAEEEAVKRRQMQLEIERYQRQVERLQSQLKQDPAKKVRTQVKKIQRQAQARAKTDKRRRK